MAGRLLLSNGAYRAVNLTTPPACGLGVRGAALGARRRRPAGSARHLIG
jgi:hypothetical protein